MMNRAMKFIRKWHAGMLLYLFGLSVSLMLLPGTTLAAEATNRMVAISVEDAADGVLLNVETENPVGYRYTVYDSIDPIRVVVDFPGMDVEGVDAPEVPQGTSVKEVKLTSFDLTSGKLGRLEVVLDAETPYDVNLDNTSFNMSFESTQAVAEEKSEEDADEVVSSADQPESLPGEETTTVPEPVVAPADEPEDENAMAAKVASGDATTVSDVSINASSVSFITDGQVEIFKYFTLGAPPRLVVDVYGVNAGFAGKKFTLGNGFERLRVGNYKDKIRFVLDAVDKIPDYTVSDTANSIYVAWGDAAEDEAPRKPEQAPAGVPVNVEAVDFKVEDAESVLQVTLSDSAKVIAPTLKDGIIGFGLKNATISRSLRRAIDASSFPSSIRLVTPYTVLVGENQDVRFAVELKGPSEYSLDTEDNVITLKVENGPFAEPDFVEDEQVAVKIADGDVKAMVRDDIPSGAMEAETAESEMLAGDDERELPAEEVVVSDDDDFVKEIEREADSSIRRLSSAREMGYTGQRISLVFDNADIRNILQLIAEVSNLNILAGDGVDGTITLRLIDVPWDQALDLILETKDLGMLRDGNVARILPKESIRAMDEAKFTAARTKEKLQDLEKAVITVNYTDLENVSGPAKEFLTDRGTITEDTRNKKLIIKDIPKVIEDIRELVAELDTPEKQVLIEARIVEVNTSANLNLGINWNIFYSQDASFDPLDQNSGGQVGLGGNFTVPAFAAGTGQSAGIGSEFSWGKVGVNTTVLDLRLSALETAGDGQVISNPRIMTLNGEQAKISQGTQIPYQTVSADEIRTELVEAALSLEVTPVINPDNSVILELKATNSRPGSTVATGAGAAPSIDTKEAETKMLVQDGETMVIGGIYVEQDDFSESGVPILMHIPLLGNLFKSTQTNKNRNELMIFITPRIVE